MADMKRFNFYLAESQIKKLEVLSERTGLSSSEIIRRAIDEYWDRNKRKKGGS